MMNIYVPQGVSFPYSNKIYFSNHQNCYSTKSFRLQPTVAPVKRVMFKFPAVNSFLVVEATTTPHVVVLYRTHSCHPFTELNECIIIL